MSTKTKKGIILALITSLISGVAIFYNKLVIIKGIDSLTFNIIKNGGTAIILSFIILTPKTFRKIKILSPSSIMKLITIGLAGGSVPFLLYFEGLKTVSAVNASLIHKTLFIWAGVLAIPFLGERLNFIQVAGYIIVCTSNLFIGGLEGFTGNKGEVLILLATLLWATESIFAKIYLQKIESEILCWGRMFFGSLFLVFIAFSQNKLLLFFSLTADLIIPIAGSVFLLTGYVLTFYKALKLAPVTAVTSLLVLSTPITNILAALFITHNFTGGILINFLSTLSGLALIAYFSQKSFTLPKRSIVKVSP